jgi:hypothetical protein
MFRKINFFSKIRPIDIFINHQEGLFKLAVQLRKFFIRLFIKLQPDMFCWFIQISDVGKLTTTNHQQPKVTHVIRFKIQFSVKLKQSFLITPYKLVIRVFKFLLKVGVEESIVNAPLVSLVCRVKTQTSRNQTMQK